MKAKDYDFLKLIKSAIYGFFFFGFIAWFIAYLFFKSIY